MEQHVSTPTTVLGRWFVARRAAHPQLDRSLAKLHPLHLHPLRRIRKSPLLRPLAFLGFLGPGLIAANAGNDAGAIATWSSVGALYGFQMLWVLVVITVALSVIQEMCARMGVATGQGLSDLIRERFGVRGAAFAMCTLLIANSLITISEFAGIAAAAELVGIPKYVAVPIAAVAIWLLITRGSYARVQTIFLVMSLAFFTYPIAAVLARPDWGQVLHHTVVPSVHVTSLYLQLLVGTVGTTITPYMQFFIQASVAEKGMDMEHYAGERAETYFGSIFAAVIVASIVIATGATVYAASHGQGVVINSAEQAAQALTPFLGTYAPVLFAVGLLGASLLAAAVLPLSTAYSITESFGFERGVSYSFREAPIFHGIFTGMLVLGVLIALVPGLPLIQLIVVSQIINGILLPFLLVFILRLVNDRRIMGEHINSRLQNIIGVGTASLLAALSAVMLASIFLPTIGIPFLQ
jgi:NRAMP (natural resistance-associated macrophage protein)-like metal ion transporter